MRPLKPTTGRYTIERLERLEQIDGETADFLLEVGRRSVDIYSAEQSHLDFDYLGYMKNNYLWLCRRDGRPVGVMLAGLRVSVFDQRTKFLIQDLFHVLPGSGRAAYLLLREFVDFGRLNANHVFTTIAEHTNIKGSSLAKLGFKKVEEIYRMEIK